MACAKEAPGLWFDVHNHLQDPRLGGDAAALVSAQREAGICGSVVHATCEADWPAVLDLHERFPEAVRPAFGIHPWCAHTARAGWQDRLKELLEVHPEAVIGECGLDGWISAPAFSTQVPVFLDHLRIARETGRAITIHCLKAWGVLFETLDGHRPVPRMMFHSFGGSAESSRRLHRMGAYFSFSGYFLHARKRSVLEVFRGLPRDRLLVETDAPDMAPPECCMHFPSPPGTNHPANLAAIGRAFARELGMEEGELAALTTYNARCWLDR